MASLIRAGASIVGGLISKSSADKEADQAAEARLGTEQRATEQLEPFRRQGVQANRFQKNLLGMGSDEAGDAAFQNFLGSTGFRSQLQAGSDAITGNQAASGLLNSGSTLKRLSTFGQGLAQQGFSNFLGQVGNVANRGLSAASSQAGATTSLGDTGQAAGIRREGTSDLISGIGQGVQTIFDRNKPTTVSDQGV